MQFDEQINYSRVFYLPRGEQIPRWPDPVAPREVGIRGYSLIGVRRDGAVLLMSHGPEPFPLTFPIVERYTAFTPGKAPETVEISLNVHGCSARGASADGRVFAFEGDCTRDDSENTPNPPSFFVTEDGVLTRLGPKAVSFEPQVRVLEPPPGSYFARTPPAAYAYPPR